MFVPALCIAVAYSQAHKEPATLSIGSVAPDFSLKGVDGKLYTLKDFSKAEILVIIFSCNHCPTAQAYEQRIIDLDRDYKSKNVQTVMISPNSPKAVSLSELGYTDLGDTYEEMKIRAGERGFRFPYLYDGDEQKAALAYGPVATPHCFVFDKNRILRYAGRVDSSEKPGTGKGEDIRAAVDAVLSGRTVTPSTTKVFGCSIKWSWKDESVQRIFKQWSELPVTLDEIDVAGIKDLVKNSSNKLRLINFWATWCDPCRDEFPDLVKIDAQYRPKGLEFIVVSLDDFDEIRTEVPKFLREMGAEMPAYLLHVSDPEPAIKSVDPNWGGALPATFLYNQKGELVFKHFGRVKPDELRAAIDKEVGSGQNAEGKKQ